jgi:hypothetical protein
MAAAAKSFGWNPFRDRHDQLAPYQNRSGCMYHGFCNRGGCHVDGRTRPR